MGYIRTNEDYYISCGYSPREAEIKSKMDEQGVDYGYCNPMKAKIADEQEKKIRQELRDNTAN
jgi:hypothetical protein